MQPLRPGWLEYLQEPRGGARLLVGSVVVESRVVVQVEAVGAEVCRQERCSENPKRLW